MRSVHCDHATVAALSFHPGRCTTAREREVVALTAEGRSNRGIREKLVLSPKAVESRVNGISRSSGSLPRPTVTGACWPSSSSFGKQTDS